MDTLTRRKFLSLTAGAVAAGAIAPILSEDQIAQAAITRPLPSGTPILVMVTLIVVRACIAFPRSSLYRPCKTIPP